ncbi:MAG: hypothetical protein ACOYBL_12605 [Lachnospiraceae bacterium]|jgi:hypothetical protein
MKDYSEKADSNLAGKLGFRQEEIMPLSNWNSQFHTCGNSLPSVKKSPINQRISPFGE